MLFDYLDGPQPLGVSPITAAWEIYNPVLTTNFSNQRKILTDRYQFHICVSYNRQY